MTFGRKMPESDPRRKEYNLRTQAGGKKLTSSSTKRKELGESTTSHSTTHGAILPQGATGGAPAVDMPTSSGNANVTSVHDDSTSTSGPPPPHTVPLELQSFMKDVKEMFRNFTTQVNAKLDSVVSQLTDLKIDLESTKTDLESTKKTVSDMQDSLTDNSTRLLAFENKSMPELRKLIDTKIAELDVKLTLSEIHDRKQNLLVYGIPPKPNENVYETVYDICCNFMNIQGRTPCSSQWSTRTACPRHSKATRARSANRPQLSSDSLVWWTAIGSCTRTSINLARARARASNPYPPEAARPQLRRRPSAASQSVQIYRQK